MTRIELREVGKRAGWIGLVFRDQHELYRTGSYWPTASDAFAKVSDWMDKQEDIFNAA